MAAASIIDVVRSPTMRGYFLLMVAINFLSSVVYYGLNLNVVNLETNIYLSVLLNVVAVMPSYLLTVVLLNRFGRRPLAIGTMWLSGVFYVMCSIVSGAATMKEERMIYGVIRIFGMAATYNLLFIYTVEIFPTMVRNAALGCTTQAAHMGVITAPLLVVLGGPLSFVVFDLYGMAGGFLAFLLSDMMNRPLYDTMVGFEEGERH